MNPAREPETVELLASEYQRRLTVAGHHQWRESISSARPFDEVDRSIDEDFDDLIVVDPYEVHAPSRRSDKNLGEFLSLIDSLETGNDRKEITR
jgi:hypothetical protein